MDNNIPDPIQPGMTQHESSLEPKSHFWMLFVALFILGLFFLGGTYYFIVNQKNQQAVDMITNQTVETHNDINQLETDVQSLEMKDIESDFTEVDQELKNL